MSRPSLKALGIAVLVIAIGCGILWSFPFALSLKVERDRAQALTKLREQFPVTVDPERRRIVENEQVNEYLLSADSPFQAALGNTGTLLWSIFEQIATTIASTPLYQSIAAADGRFVTIVPGMRKEQVARAFARALGWTARQEERFLASATSTRSGAPAEGVFSPGVYVVAAQTSPEAARAAVDERFDREILSRYGAAVAEVVPLHDALTIASLIQREAGGTDDMRIISGIIWNRLFRNMRLQIDATVQYARANNIQNGVWWPMARPADLRIKSPYNTYVHQGLPPGPISNPSVAAVLAALNPVITKCLFYFHDQLGQFHCSPDYQGHVALLKKHYGRGK